MHNLRAYGDLTVSRGSGALMPLYRVYTVNKLLRPSNGPKSQALANAVANDLLRQEPYRSYGVTLQTFFASGDARMWSDMIPLSDRVWGWNSKYSVLRDAAIEAVRAHPFEYLRSYIIDVARLTLQQGYMPEAPLAVRNVATESTVARHPDGRAIPTEGQHIPQSRVWWLATAPDGPRSQTDIARAEADARSLGVALPVRDGSSGFASALNTLGRFLPAPGWFLIVGCCFFPLMLRSSQGQLLLFMMLLVLANIAITMLGMDLVYQYRIPFDPIIMGFAAVSVGAFLRGKARRNESAAKLSAV